MFRKAKLIYPILAIILGLIFAVWYFIPKKPIPLKPTITMEAVREGAEYPDKVKYDRATGNYWYYYKDWEGKEKYWIFEPGTKIKGKVNVKIEFVPAIESYRYNYEVFSSKSSLQKIDYFTLGWFKVPVTNIAFRGPDDPSNWWPLPTLLDEREPLIQWCGYEEGKIKPGSTQTGFSFESKGLPGIVDCYLQGDTETPFLPEEDETVDLPPDSFHDSIAGKTVGPSAIPEPFNSEEFLNNIVSLKDESFKLGWIDTRMLSFRLGNRLRAIGKAISEKDASLAKDLIQSFIKEVESLKDEHLTPEAYYILKFNAQYLLDHLT